MDTPPAAPLRLMACWITGVETTPRSATSCPQASNPDTTPARSITPLSRGSRPITTSPGPRKVPKADAKSIPCSAVKPRPTIPRKPTWEMRTVRGIYVPGRLPDAARRRFHHRLARLACERFLKFRHVLDDAVHTELAGGVFVALRLRARVFIGLIGAPDLRPAQKEALFRCESVALGRNLAAQCIHQRHVRDPHAAVVGRVFAQRELPIQLYVIDGVKTGVLIHDALRAILERLVIYFRPPVAQVALRVILAALIVEAVGQLMPDHRADRAEIDRVVHAVVIKRRLQNSGGEIDVVLLRIVIGVYGGLAHLPIHLVQRLADCRELPGRLEQAGAGPISPTGHRP